MTTSVNNQQDRPGVSVLDRPRRTWTDVERYFDRLMRGFPPWTARRGGRPTFLEGWFPDIDVFERDDKIVLRADLPGMKSEDIDVSLAGDLLTVSGRRQEATEVKEENYYCSERSTGEFSRTIRLPEGVVADDVQATYTDGVLEVTVPRPPQSTAETKRVPVK
jgi:HSP20 family protein